MFILGCIEGIKDRPNIHYKNRGFSFKINAPLTRTSLNGAELKDKECDDWREGLKKLQIWNLKHLGGFGFRFPNFGIKGLK